MGGKNTISSSKRRKGSDRRFSSKSKNKTEDKVLPPPAVISVKPRHQSLALKALAACALIIILIVTGSSWRRRSIRRQALLDDLDNDRLLSTDGDKTDAASLLEEVSRKEVPGQDASQAVHADPRSSHRQAATHSHTGAEQHSHHETHARPSHEPHGSPGAHHSASHGYQGQSHDVATHPGRAEHDASAHGHHESAHQSPTARLESAHQSPAAHEVAHHAHTGRSGGREAAPALLAPVLHSNVGLSIKDFHSVIEWYARDDLKSGGRPLCRISKPCILSNGLIAFPSWMKKSSPLLTRCGLGAYTFYDDGTKPPGVKHVTEIGADFALTIHPTKFQEPTHILSVFLTEHVLKSSFLFDTFAGRAKYGDGIKVSHCFASESGTDCANDNKPETVFQPALFVPKRLQLGKANAWGMKLVDMFGVAHSHDRSTVHLNLSTILVPGHKDMRENLYGTCFRSILTADAMFRHFPPRAMIESSLFSTVNGIERADRDRKSSGKCSLNIGIFDLQEGPRGIIGIEDFKSSVEQFAKLALPDAEVNVELIRTTPDTPLEDHIKLIQTLDVFVAGSGDEMSSLAFLRGSAIVFEILQFGLNPDTHRSLAASVGIRYNKMHSKPSTQVFKACMETQIMNLRKKGKLGESEFPPWYSTLMETWEAAVGEYTLSGKTDFDLLSNHTAIANFDSRHCGKMQSLVFNHEDSARAIIVEAKGLCNSA